MKFRTEVVRSKNLRKSKAYKIFNAVAILIFLFVILLSGNLLGNDSIIVRWFSEHYHAIVRPAILVFAGIVVIFSLVASSAVRTPIRLGSIEIDDQEVRYLENDEVKDSFPLKRVNSVFFEFTSMRNRSNPAGCMNYLVFKTDSGNWSYEIVVGNEINKSELGEVLTTIDSKAPVTIKYALLLKRLFKDKDFKTLRTI